MSALDALAAQWRQAKEAETAAIEQRRRIEDEIVALAGIPETAEGVHNVEAGAFVIKITGRLNRKVDGDKLQEIAAEHGLTDHLSTLFRWKPEIVAKAWAAAAANITTPLLAAITTTPGRPSVAVVEAKKEK